jgi:Fe2+ or Zn2+ uptake regulation protein
VSPTHPFRLTPQRAAVWKVMREARDHPTAREVYRRVQARHPGIGFATVYRTLNLLIEHRKILELHLGDTARYDSNTAPHEHVRCISCGTIADINVPLPASTAWRAARDSGFDVDCYELQFFGRCAECRINTSGR